MVRRLKESLAHKMSAWFQLDNQIDRDLWVNQRLLQIPAGHTILDAGCGSQRYRATCSHLQYTSQDFGQYTVDERGRLGSPSANEATPYEYGEIDVVSDIWNIPLPNESFDAVLCTEVLEHVPYPIETVKELSRLLRPGGQLILTVPSNALRHQDPYFFTSGFSDRWLERILPEHDLEIQAMTELGDYYSWMKVEIARTAGVNGIGAKIVLLPAFLYFSGKRPTSSSRLTMTMGYMLTAVKK